MNENGQELFSERTFAHETETYEGCLNLTSDCYEFSIIGYAGYGTTQANWTIDFETSTDLSGTISGNETDTETFGACSGRKLETTTSIRRPKKLHYTIDEEGGMVDLTVLSPNDEQTDIKIEIASIESGIIVEELYRGPVSVNKPIIVSFDAGNIYVATYKAIITNMASPDDAKELVLFRELPQ